MRSLGAWLGLVGALVLLLLPAPAADTAGPPATARPLPDILLVTVDTLRADFLGCTGDPRVLTPYIDRLAKQGALWPFATTAVPVTLPSHTCLFTGLGVEQHGLLHNTQAVDPRQPRLIKAFQSAGYRPAAFVSAVPLSGRLGLADGFETYADLDRLRRAERPADQTVDLAIEWLGERPPGPCFLWVHLYDPHTPYWPPEPYRSLYGPKEGAAPLDALMELLVRETRKAPVTAFRGTAAQLEYVIGLYRGEITFVDRQLGRIFSRFCAAGPSPGPLVVLTADHGEELGEHGIFFGHGPLLFESSVAIPLIAWQPGVLSAGRLCGTRVRICDILPTVAELVGVPLPAETTLAGSSFRQSLLDGREEARECFLAAEPMPGVKWNKPVYAWRTGEQKLIATQFGLRLFDLAADPAERTDVAGKDSELVRQAQAAVTAHAEQLARAQALPAALDEQDREALKALGYVQ